MSNEAAVVAESQPAEVADVFNGENVSLAEFSSYRESGELPERFKSADNADPAPAEETEGDEPESEPDSDPDRQQEKPKGKRKEQTAEERIAQLEATIHKIAKGAGLERKAEVAPATEQPATPQNYAEWRKSFKPSAWVEDFARKNPESTYEDANAAMADFLGDVRDQFKGIEQQRQSQAQELNAKVAEARARYGDNFDEVLQPTLSTIIADKGINPNVKAMINDSEVIADLVFTLGSDEKTLNEFVKMAKETPGKALRYIAAVEMGIAEELAGKDETRNDKGQFAAKESPAKPKTGAPKPPSPVSGASSGAFDVSDESLSNEEWMRQRTVQVNQRRG